MNFRQAPVLVVMGTSAILAAVSNLVLRYAMAGLAATDSGVAALGVAAVTSKWVLGGFLGYALSQLLWLKVLSQARIGATFPIFISSTFVIVIAGSILVLDEELTIFRIVGTLLVALGIIISEWSSSDAAKHHSEVR